jgi:hypothetical protein
MDQVGDEDALGLDLQGEAHLWEEAEVVGESSGPASAVLSSQDCSRLLEVLEQVEGDSKWEACRSVLARVWKEGTRSAVVFTEFADTARYLADLSRECGWPTRIVTGGDSVEERTEAVRVLRQEPGVLIATSAGAEGLSLGFVKDAVHYDVPWQPGVLFQRFGRLERLNAVPGPSRHYFLIDGIVTPAWFARRQAEHVDLSGAGTDIFSELMQHWQARAS